MEQSKIERINFLAKKAKADGLTESELTEQAELRREYIESYKTNLRAQLGNIYFVDAEGNKKKCEKKS